MGRAAGQERPQVQDLREEKKRQLQPTVFLAANQNLMLCCVVHERESGKRVTWYFLVCGGGVEGKEPDIHYSSKSPDEGLNTTFWQNRPPI